MIIPRPYQIKLENDIDDAWLTHTNVAAVLPTGGGKTVIFSNIIRKNEGYSMAIAHRQELVSQISLSLATSGVSHNIIAPEKTIRWICSLHQAEFGKVYYDPKAKPHVAGVDTLIRRAHKWPKLCEAVTLWVIDECHHVLRKNKWGKAVALFPNARGLGVTATFVRSDGNGLGRSSDGVFDVIRVGPTMRELINQKYLSDYIIYSIPSDMNLHKVGIGANGDYVQQQLKTSSRESHIVGDIVDHYLKIAPGKIGVTFVTDVETAGDVAMQFRHKGVPAQAVHAKTPAQERHDAVRKLARGELKQLVNVDLFGEGFDLPAIEVISMARPTMSYGLFCQQFGRVLRILMGKGLAIILDHVGNVMNPQLGLPDNGRVWSLERREKRASAKDPNLLPVRTCFKCTAVWEGYKIKCPYCGYVHTPTDRSKPEFVEGDLTILDPETLRILRGEIDRIDAPPEAVGHKLRCAGAPTGAVMGAMAQHTKRQAAQQALRDTISVWAGIERAKLIPDAESYRKFFHKFGVDVFTAQAYGRPEAERLTNLIIKDYHDNLPT